MKNLSAAYFLYVTIVGSAASCLACVSLLDASFKSTLWLVLAVATCLMLARASAASRHLLWATTMLGLLLLPVCTLLLPEWRVLPGCLVLEHRIDDAASLADGTNNLGKLPPFTSLKPVHAPVRDSVEITIPVDARAGNEADEWLGSPANVSVDSVPNMVPLQKATYFTEPFFIKLNASLVLAVWATGCLIGLIPLIAAVFRLRYLERIHRCDASLDLRIAKHVRSLCGTLGIRMPIVIVGPQGAMPMVWTFKRSRLLLPVDALQWSRNKLNAVVSHELIHLRRRDPFVCSLALVARALNWFNPLAWYAVKRLRVECEQACDDQVLRMGVEPSDYASHLLDLSTNMCFLSSAGPVAIAMASSQRVEARIVAILNERQNRRGVTLGHVCLTLIAGTLFAATLASIATRAAAAKNFQEETVEWAPEVPKTADDGQVEKMAGIDNGNPEKDTEPKFPTASHHLDNGNFGFINFSLEECIVYALSNTPIAQNLSGLQGKHAELAALSLLNQRPKSTTASESATTLTTTNPQPTITDYRVLPRGAARENQSIGGAIMTLSEFQHPLTRDRRSLEIRILAILRPTTEDVSIAQYEERVQNIVRDVECAYWDLYAAYFIVDTAKTAVDSSGLAWKIANSKSSMSASAEAQARVTCNQFKAQLEAAIAGGGSNEKEPGLFGREQNLRLLMGLAANDGRLVRPSDKPAIGCVEFDWNTVREETLSRNFDLRNNKWRIKQRELELISAKNQTLPDVNLALNYRWLGVGSNSIDRQGGNALFPVGSPSAFEELFGGRYLEGSVRMEFNPNAIGSRRQLNDVQNKQLALAREHQFLEVKEIAAVHKLSALWQQLDSLHKQLTQEFQALSAAQTLACVSQAKFDAGDSDNLNATIDNLLRAQQTRSQASQNFIRSLVEYNKSLVDLHCIKGSLLEYNSIQLEQTAKQIGKTEQPNGDKEHPIIVWGPPEKSDAKPSSDPPSDDEIVYAFEKSLAKSESNSELKRKHIRIEKEKTHEAIEPARFVPLIGNASVHHAYYRCKILELKTESKTRLQLPNQDETEAEHLLYVDHVRFKIVAEQSHSLNE